LVRKNDRPFGGIQLILSGDFLQLPPVKDRWLFESDKWNDLQFSAFIFEEPQRYSDLKWFHFLLRARKGDISQKDVAMLRERVEAYEKLKENTLSVKPTILYSRRVDVESYNKTELDKLEGKMFTYQAVDTFSAYKPSAIREYYTKPLEDTIPTVISLKIGAQVMLKVNFDVDNCLVNGSRGVIIELTPYIVSVKWVNGTVSLITPYTWEQKDKKACATRTQIPLILAWSATIHKSQGCTLDSVVCDIGNSVFCPGQAYVALSRVRCLEGLYLSGFKPSSIMADPSSLEFVKGMEGGEINVIKS
jgi:ATP-dependent DNA helicase PIF1